MDTKSKSKKNKKKNKNAGNTGNTGNGAVPFSNNNVQSQPKLLEEVKDSQPGISSGSGSGPGSTSTDSKTDLLAQLLCKLQVPEAGQGPSNARGAGGLDKKLEDTKSLFLSCLNDQNVQSEIPGLPPALLGNLQKLFSQDPIADIESSDDNEEYIEYVYKPRRYFLVSMCQHCKCLLKEKDAVQCYKCQLMYYCSVAHCKADKAGHKKFCSALNKIAKENGGNIFNNTGPFTHEEFRSYRLLTIRKAEELLRRRPLQPFEQEAILFPRICCQPNCREWDFRKLQSCDGCGQIAFCQAHPEHLSATHGKWCKAYDLFQKTIEFHEKFGKVDPSFPTKVLTDFPAMCASMRKVLEKLNAVYENDCEYAALTQIATGPLTAWYGLKLCDKIRETEITVHLIGAELDFEVDGIQKWELFFTHMTPSLNCLNVVFIGPELNPNGISFQALMNTKSCRVCRKNNRTTKYHFENRMYHDYCKMKNYLEPNLICFFNPGLYRCTGYKQSDTWPASMEAAAQRNCPVVVTSYTEYESPLDLNRFLEKSQRKVNIVLPPVVNPFASEKPERNFISEEEAPIMFKNYFCFVLD